MKFFSRMFDLEASDWAEKLAAYVYLAEVNPGSCCLGEDLEEKVTILLDHLNNLPRDWAREICFEVHSSL